MSRYTRQLRACYEELRAEIYAFEHSGDLHAPEEHRDKTNGYSPLKRYDHEELIVAFPSADCVFILWPRWPRATNPQCLVTYALHEGTRAQLKEPSLGHFNSDAYTPAKLVFYAALHYQLRQARERLHASKQCINWMHQLKTDRPEVFATLRVDAGVGAGADADDSSVPKHGSIEAAIIHLQETPDEP